MLGMIRTEVVGECSETETYVVDREWKKEKYEEHRRDVVLQNSKLE